MFRINAKLTHFANPRADVRRPYADVHRDMIGVAHAERAMGEIRGWPGYGITPLYALNSLAGAADIAALWYKDESHRFGTKSFKALGGPYALARQLQRMLTPHHLAPPSIAEFYLGRWKSEVKELVVTCATDGNHGRSVAWAARMFGCRCVIYIPKVVSANRKQAIESLGAQVIRVNGNYDDAVHQADSDATAKGRIVVSDTSYEGYMGIPKDVTIGYTVMLAEIVEQLRGDIPTHVFVQGGVGALACAVCGYFWDLWGDRRPRLIVVEPEQANCMQLSAKAGEPTIVDGDMGTLMTGLACGEVSALAWELLSIGADDFMTLGEEAVPPAMRLLARGYAEDPIIEAGESAVPGLATLLLARDDESRSSALGLNADSKVLVFGTEGATDPDLYQHLVG